MDRFRVPSTNASRHSKRANWPSIIALALALLCGRIAVGQTAPSVQDLVAAHDSSLQQIHSADIEAVMQQAERFDAADADLRFRDARQYRLRFSGVQQRLTERALETPRPARNYYVDSYSDGSVRWTLRDFDRDHPPRITPLEPAGAEGNISLEIPGQMPSPTEWMLLSFRVGTGKPLAGAFLRNFVSAFQKAEVIGEESIDGSRCWKLRLFGPATTIELSDLGDFVDLFLDPEAGFRVRQKTVHFAHFKIANPTGAGTTVGTYETMVRVSSFQEHAPGIFLPKEGEAWVTPQNRDRPLRIARCSFSVKSVNSKIDAAAFRFEFPEYLRVVDIREGTDQPKLNIWDKGNKPGVPFHSTNDLIQFRHLDQKASHWKTSIYAVTALFIVAVLGVLVYQKRSRA